MLHRINSPHHDANFAYGTRYVTYDDIVAFFRRYFQTIFASLLLGFTIAAGYAYFSQPIFTARAQLFIDSKLPLTIREQSSGDGALSLDTPQMESQIAVLRSEAIAEQIVDDLYLLSEPEFQIETYLSRGWRRLFPFFSGSNQRWSEFERRRHAVNVLQSGLDVRRVSVSYVLDIAYSSQDPDRAARIANEIAERFVRDQLATRARAARQGSDWLEERIDELRKQMNAAALAVQEFKARRDYRIVGRRDRNSEGDVPQPRVKDNASVNEEANTLEELETRSHTYRRIFESYLQAYAESVQRQSYPVANARIISKASRPLGKSYPKTTLLLTLGLMLGALTGCGISVLRHSMDRSIQSAQQLREVLGIECLGECASLEYAGSFARRPKDEKVAFREVIDAPFSRFSDSVKRVKSSLGFAFKGQQALRIGITSALPGEGKTILACNLARLYALSGARTLLVDADFRNPTLSLALAANQEHGLINVLEGLPLSQCVVTLGQGAPDLLPSVPGQFVLNSEDALGSEAMRALLTQLPQSHDVTIIDLPPLKPVTDAITVSAMVDGVIVVVEWGKTAAPIVADAVHQMRKVEAKLLGAVLTKVPVTAPRLYGGYGVERR